MDQPVCTQKSPFVLECDAGTYAWCACGKSQKQPYCDGSHAGSSFRPIVQTLDEKKKVAWCGCRRSNNKPFCDGTHRSLA